jgi:hypothetical protein
MHTPDPCASDVCLMLPVLFVPKIYIELHNSNSIFILVIFLFQPSVSLSASSYLMTSQSTLTLIPTNSLHYTVLYCSIAQYSSGTAHPVYTASTNISLHVHRAQHTASHTVVGHTGHATSTQVWVIMAVVVTVLGRSGSLS